MTLRFSLREHKIGPTYAPAFTFSKPSGSILRMNSTTASTGKGYVFVVVPRAWLHGKYIRWRWQGSYTWGALNTVAEIMDGEYTRSSMTDFPDGAGRATKGMGLLQTLSNKLGSFAWETGDVQANVAAGTEVKCTIFFEFTDAWNSQSGYMDMDWFEINSAAGGVGNLYSEPFDAAVTMEVSGTSNDYGYISSGEVYSDGSADLFAKFSIFIGGFEDLKARFEVGQGSEDLFAKFVSRPPWVDLFGKFIVSRSASISLKAIFLVRQYNASADLKAKFYILPCYDLSNSRGISFMWWGSGGADQMIDFEMTSPTGAWTAKFPDGPAEWQWIFLSWDDLTEVDIDGSRPDRSEVCGFYWTYHTPGLRRVDRISAYNCADLKAIFIVRQLALGVDLKGVFLPKFSASEDLKAKFDITHNVDLKAIFTIPYDVTYDIPCKMVVRNTGYADLLVRFEVKQGVADLKCVFRLTREDLKCIFSVRRSSSADLKAVFISQLPSGFEDLPSEIYLGEDFTTYTEVDGDV